MKTWRGNTDDGTFARNAGGPDRAAPTSSRTNTNQMVAGIETGTPATEPNRLMYTWLQLMVSLKSQKLA